MATPALPLPQLNHLPQTLPLDNAIRIELVEGALIFRASATVQERIEALLDKQSAARLTKREMEELDLYEEVDDYLSYVNRTIRNQLHTQSTL